MTDFIVSAESGVLAALLAVALVLGTYFLSRRFLSVGDPADRTHEVAGSVATRIAALHGLILALVYAQELDDYKGVRTALTEESIAVSDVYNDARRYGGPVADSLRGGLALYLLVVVTEEWDELGRGGRLTAKAWQTWEGVYETVLDLTPATDRERHLADRMRSRTADIARLRQMREATATSGFSLVFWGPALFGLVLLTVPFAVYRPTRTHLTMITVYAVYSGVILFFIYAFSNPFEPPGRLQPRPFQLLLQGEIGRSLPPGTALP